MNLIRKTVSSNEFAYFFNNTHCFPIIAVHYSETHVLTDNFDDLYVIYAYLDTPERRLIATSTNMLYFKDKGAIVRGCFGYNDNIDEYIKEHPDYNNSYVLIPNMLELTFS